MRHKSSTLFSWNFNFFQQKEPIKVQMNLVKIYLGSRKSEILHFDGFLLSKSHDTEEWCKVLKKNWLVVSHMTWWRTWWIFTEPLRSLKISFRWTLFLKSMQGLSCKNTKESPFMTLNTDENWINLDLMVPKIAWSIGWNFIRAFKYMNHVGNQQILLH